MEVQEAACACLKQMRTFCVLQPLPASISQKRSCPCLSFKKAHMLHAAASRQLVGILPRQTNLVAQHRMCTQVHICSAPHMLTSAHAHAQKRTCICLQAHTTEKLPQGRLGEGAFLVAEVASVQPHIIAPGGRLHVTTSPGRHTHAYTHTHA